MHTHSNRTPTSGWTPRGTGTTRSGFLLIAVVAVVAACSDTAPAPETARAQPPEISDQECAVCGMLVRDQPAPRGLAIHRDGTQAFTCSLGDLLVELSSPSPHGRVTEVLVEVMGGGEDPSLRQTHAHAWVAADSAWYVLGVERGGIMGPPVLAYAQRADADAIAGSHEGARAVDFAGLEAWWRERQR